MSKHEKIFWIAMAVAGMVAAIILLTWPLRPAQAAVPLDQFSRERWMALEVMRAHAMCEEDPSLDVVGLPSDPISDAVVFCHPDRPFRPPPQPPLKMLLPPAQPTSVSR